VSGGADVVRGEAERLLQAYRLVAARPGGEPPGGWQMWCQRLSCSVSDLLTAHETGPAEQDREMQARIATLPRCDAIALAQALAHGHEPAFVTALLGALDAAANRFAWFGEHGQ
jgi:hypothetical protein